MKESAIIILSISVFAILYPHCLYPLILFLLEKLKRRRSVELPDGHKNYPFVSIVIAAYNEEKVIERKILNAFELDYPIEKIEILIGSDGSTDKTDEICQRYTNAIKYKRIESRQGKANVLNTLVPLAKGSIILFSDANTIFETDSVKNIVFPFEDGSVGAVCGKLILKAINEKLESYEGVYWNFESRLKCLESKIFSTIGANGGIYAVRKKLYKEIPVDTIIDDFWISLNILEYGKRIIFEENCIAYEDVSESIIDEFWRKVRIGAGNMQAFMRRPLIFHKSVWFLYMQSIYYSHKVIRWLTPFFLVLMYSSIIILSSHTRFVFLLYICNSLMIIGLLGVVFETKNKIFNLAGYFMLLNFALLLGYTRYLLGKQKVTWRRAER